MSATRPALDVPGRIQKLGPFEVHVRERAGVEPPVVLMAGCGLAMEFWRDVVALLPERHLVGYDRPGMGGTHWPGHLPKLSDEVSTLRALLRSQAMPCVLVAHSMAAFHAEAVARMYPELVAGIVLVDPSVEFIAKPPAIATVKPARAVRTMARNFRLGSAIGVGWRFGTWMQSNRTYKSLGYGRIPAIYRDADSLAMGAAESIAYRTQAWDLLELRPRCPFPTIPVILLSAERGDNSGTSQARLSALLGARQVWVRHTNHLLMLDAPDVVADAINQVIQDAAAHR